MLVESNEYDWFYWRIFFRGVRITTGLWRIIYIVLLVILFLIFFTISTSKKKIEFQIGNLSFALPFSGYIASHRSYNLHLGDIIPNCGIELPCPSKHFSVHLHSGKSSIDMPMICVGGKYVVHRNANNSGPGFSIVIVDPHLKEAVSVKRFHDKVVNTVELKKYISSDMLEKDIIIVMTFGDVSGKLSNSGKQLFTDLGSGMIQNLLFKSQWFMISQKGLKGFTPFEELYAFQGGQLKTLDRRFCIPPQIKGQPIIPDFPVNLNILRSNFCNNHLYMEDFCDDNYKFMELQPATLINQKLMGSQIYLSPIVILGGHSLSSLSVTLETVISQPGIQPNNVLVVFNPSWIKDVQELCHLFGFTSLESDAQQYWEIIQDAFDGARSGFPEASFITIIEDEVILSPDFLQYTGRMLNLLNDPTIIGISAWNPNGFSGVSSKLDVAYRINSFFGVAFTVKLNTYVKDIKPILRICCDKSGWQGWNFTQLHDREIIIPEVSRCFLYPNMINHSSFFNAHFNRTRETNLDPYAEIQNPKLLHFEKYDNNIKARCNPNNSVTLTPEKCEIEKCFEERNSKFIYDKFKKNVTNLLYVLPYIEQIANRFEGMKILCRCFGLFYDDSHDPLGLHKGTLRFSYNGNEVLVVSSHSSLFNLYYQGTTTLVLP